MIVDKVRHDKHGFLGKDGKWYANNFKEFDVNIGDDVEVVLNAKGFLEYVKTLTKGAIDKPQGKPQEYHLSPEEVKLRALEWAHGFEPNGTYEALISIADKVVEWVNL